METDFYSEDENKTLKLENENLINKIKEYRKDMDLSKVDEAFWFAAEAHKKQRRKSGEAYIIHPIAVANILADLKLDRETLIAGLLHDVVEDTEYTSNDIKEKFGEEVEFIVSGVTKLLQKEFTHSYKDSKYADNYRNMMLGSSKDPRVVLVKIADRLHNMQTLAYMTPEKQKEKAQETMNIYAPLALNFGISEWRTELEDLSFKYLEPEAFKKLKNDINKKKEMRAAAVSEIIKEIKTHLDSLNITYEIEGRYKHLYSIHRKMKKKNLSLDELYDLSAIRILVNDKAECYTVLGVIQMNYKYLLDRFKDYISKPKSNGYQSLHTAFFHKGEKYEVQIRTYEMHEISEKGVAAHWKYKGSTSGKDEYLRGIIERQHKIYEEAEQSETGTEFVETLKDELNPYSEKIYCFTPKSNVFTLSKDSTPVDFAYMIHSAVGNTMVGAKVNGIIVPFDHILKNDDIVEILTSENSSGPKLEWLEFVKMNNARSRIKSFLKDQTKETAFLDGNASLKKEAKERKYALEELLTPEAKEAMVNKHNMPNWERLVESVGRSFINGETVIKRLIQIKKNKEDHELRTKLSNLSIEDAGIDFKQFEREGIRARKSKNRSKTGVFVQGEADIETHFAACCSPIPGDEIIGFITKGRGVTIHRTDCKNILNMPNEIRNRLMESTWDRSVTKEMSFDVNLNIEAEDRASLALDINRILVESKVGVNIFNSRRAGDKAFFDITLRVDTEEQLNYVTNKILNLTHVYEIRR